MVFYNTTTLDAAIGPHEIAIALNQMSNGLLGIMILLTTALLTLLIFRNKDIWTNVMLGSAFITSVVGFGLFLGGFIGITILMIPLVYLFGVIILKIWGGG